MREASYVSTKPSIVARHAPLLALLALTLFPFGWLGELWPMFGHVLDQLFPTAGRHALGHATIFCLLGLAALAVMPRLRTRPWRYLGMLLLVGVGQEFFQMLYKGQLLLFDDSRDLLTDLAGMVIAFALVWGVRRLDNQAAGLRRLLRRH